jgi:hypothetical protein
VATILVAHGAWSAGWAWIKMHPLMRARGHRLVTPTYTGIGERAHLAHPGIDLVSPDTREAHRKGVAEQGEGWRIPPNPVPDDTPQADREWILARRVMQPLATFAQPLRVSGAGDHLPRSYIYCTRAAPGDVFRQFAERARSESGWRCHDLDASHSPNITAPEALADLLAVIAGG